MTSKHFALPLAAVALAWGTAALALPTAVSSTVGLVADSNAGAGTVTDTDGQSQGATINPLSASVRASAVNGGATVDAYASATATWASTAAGKVTFSNIGWNTSNVDSSGSADLTSGVDWSYTFVADANGLFTLNWSNSDSGSTNTFGLNGFNFGWSGGAGQFLDFATSGTLSRAIVAGDSYTVTLGNQANISGALGTRLAEMDAVFDWSMDAGPAVPEPSMLALVGLGLGLLPLLRRRTAASA